MNSTGKFNIVVDNLSSDTSYWVRSVSDNGLCQSKGEVKPFKTNPGALFENNIINLNSDEQTRVVSIDENKVKTRESFLNHYIKWLKSLDEPESEYYVKHHPFIEKLIELPFIKTLL